MEQNSAENHTAPAALCASSQRFARMLFGQTLPAGAGECRRSAEIHLGEVERVQVSSSQAKRGRKIFRPALCDEASAAMQEHGFQASKLFCGISVI